MDKQTFNLCGYQIVYETGIDAPNNLYALDQKGIRIWQMADLCHPNDAAALVRIEDDSHFYFATYFGLSFTVEVPSFDTKKQIVK